MMIIKRITFLIFLVVLVPGCVRLPNNVQSHQTIPTSTIATIAPEVPTLALTPHDWPTSTSPPEYVEWADKSLQWLKGVPCFAPCWSGITPGITTVGEAVDLLKNNSMIEPETVQLVRTLCGDEGEDEVPNSRRIIWDWTIFHFEDSVAYYSQLDPPRTHACGLDFFRVETILPDSTSSNGIVTRIELYFPGPNDVNSNYLLMPTLGKVIEAYGEPSHIVAVYEPVLGGFTLNVIYEPQGFVLMRQESSRLELNGEVYFLEIIFSSEPIQAGLMYYSAAVLNEWQGMQSFDYYCRLENGERCK